MYVLLRRLEPGVALGLHKGIRAGRGPWVSGGYLFENVVEHRIVGIVVHGLVLVKVDEGSGMELRIGSRGGKSRKGDGEKMSPL